MRNWTASSGACSRCEWHVRMSRHNWRHVETELREVSSGALSAELRNGLLNVQKAIQSSLDASTAIETTMRGVMSFLKESVTGSMRHRWKMTRVQGLSLGLSLVEVMLLLVFGR